MPVIRAESEIEAPAHAVWRVLVDLDGYGRWNPFTPAARSTLEVGAPIDMKVALWSGLRDQRELIRAVEPDRRLCWGARIAGGLVHGERCQTLEPLGPDRTRYVTEDRISGPLMPLVMVLYGRSMRKGFEGVARGLKAYCESLPRG